MNSYENPEFSSLAELYEIIGKLEGRAEAAEAKLRAVEKLPARWHEVRNRLPSYRVPIETCTEELEAALRGEG